MKKLFSKLGNMKQGREKTANTNRAPLNWQQKALIITIILAGCILLFQLFVLINQSSIQANQTVLQSHIENQAATIRTELSNIIHTEAQAVQKAADQKINELRKQILTANTNNVAELQQIQMKLDQVSKQTKSLDTVSDKITKEVNQSLRAAPMKTGVAPKSTSPSKVTTNSSDLKTSSNYRIYSTNNYGLVLQSNEGRFIIANIGNALPGLGTITSINADEVIAGDYRIIQSPEGFKLNQLEAISAYQ